MIIVTSHKKFPVSSFGHVSSTHGRDASAHQILRKQLYPIRSYWHFPKSKMATAAILDFPFMWIWPFWRVDSAVFVLCTKFGSNICYSHWDRRTYASDVHFNVTRINFRFRLLVMWPSPHGRGASSHIIWCKISLSSPKILTFSKIKDGGRRHLGFSVYVNLAIPACW